MPTKLKDKDTPAEEPGATGEETPAPVPAPAPASVRITAQTDIRTIGDTSLGVWKDVHLACRSPIPPDEQEACYRACRGHTASCLAIVVKETECGRTATGHCNAPNIFDRTGSAPAQFPTWEAGYANLATRFDPNHPLYLPGTTVEQFVVTYQGGQLCWTRRGAGCANGETWVPNGNCDAGSINLSICQFVVRTNDYLDGEATTPVPKPIAFGLVPHPPFQDRIVDNSSAWNDLGPRVIVGSCLHSMIGSLRGTDGYFRGAAREKALTDYGIGGSTDGDLDGVIYRWNDPRGRRSPWASGPANDLDGDGAAFVRARGVAGVNRDLVSIERSDGGNIDTPMSPKQFESIARLIAYWADQAKIPWHAFPVNPAVGVVTDMQHWEFGPKECPFPAVRDRTDALQARIKTYLKQFQGGVGTDGEPPTTGGYPPNMTPELAARLFGGLVRESNGKTYPYDATGKGLISAAWMARGTAEGTWPPADVWVESGGDSLVTFKNGWVLTYQHETPNMGFFWLGAID